MQRTLTPTNQLRTSSVADNLTPGSLSQFDTLEQDLNYLRSILKQLKGTVNYDSPVLDSLSSIRDEIEDVVNGTQSLNNPTLTGTVIAPTPPLTDNSNKVSTTQFVTDKINQALVSGGGDARYIHTQSVPSNIWTISHNLNKFPSAVIVDSGNTEVEGGIEYVDNNTIIISFSFPFSGKAYLN